MTPAEATPRPDREAELEAEAELRRVLSELLTVVIEKNQAGADWGDLMGPLLSALSLSHAALSARKEKP